MKLSDIEFKENSQIEVDEQEFYFADDIFIKSGTFEKAGSVIPQHSHEYDHTTFIASGSVHAWCDEEYLGIFIAPTGITIKRNCKHLFMTISDNTTILCIHNISRNGAVDIHDLHELTFP